MLFLAVAAVCFAPRLVVVDADTQALKRLDKVLAVPDDKKAWFCRFEEQCPPSDIPTWQRLQRKAALNSKQYGKLSFALAYYGRDYNANLQRLTRPYRLHHKSHVAYTKEYGYPAGYWETEWTGYGSTYSALNLLYLKHHDLTSLGFWLDQKLDGAPAECNDDELGKLWKRHKADMLRAASNSPLRTHNLADTLIFNYYSPRDTRKLLHEMGVWSRSSDPRIGAVARQIAGQVRSHVKKVDDFDKGQKEDSKKVGQYGIRRRAVCSLAVTFHARTAPTRCLSSVTTFSYADLVRAVKRNDTAQARDILAQGVMVNRPEPHSGPGSAGEKTPLMIAAEKGNVTILKMLLACGAKVETRATGGYFSALYYAVEKGHRECVKELLAQGADPNTANVDGESALLLAARQWPDIARMLITKGADVNGSDVTGGTVLMYAVEGEQVQLVRFLLAKGADVHKKDEGEETALVHAIKKHNKVLVHLLQEARTTS